MTEPSSQAFEPAGDAPRAGGSAAPVDDPALVQAGDNASRAGAASAEDDAATMAAIARLNCKQFRTMLRVAARGLHIEQAIELLRLRGQTKLELLADDVNT